tara:strand:- start:14 stop:391 length:378 start_codon:yes stop_codon:yes gene_type:complete
VVEINSQGISSYIAQQAAPQVAEQTTTKTEQAREKKATEGKEEKKIEVRGVILEISREARKLFKADLNDEALEAILLSRRSKSSLHAAIMEAKQSQEAVTDKVSEMIDLSQKDQIKVDPEQTIAA